MRICSIDQHFYNEVYKLVCEGYGITHAIRLLIKEGILTNRLDAHRGRYYRLQAKGYVYVRTDSHMPRVYPFTDIHPNDSLNMLAKKLDEELDGDDIPKWKRLARRLLYFTLF